LTKDDLTKALRNFYASQLSNQFWGVFLILVVIVGVFGLIRNGMETSILLFVIMAAFGLIYSYFLVPLLMANKIVQDKNWSAENHWTATKDKITVNSGAGERKIKWELYQDFIDTNGFFLLIHSENKQSFQIIPKRAFESLEDEESFHQLLKSKFEKNRKSFIRQHWGLLLFVSIMILVNGWIAYILFFRK
jgi:PHD/YefM family antitoxin component YafN of YafNO toxin-antitoxin module